MSINDEGFLSPDISKWISKYRADHRDWFELADKISQLGQEMLRAAVPPINDNQKLLSALLFARILSNFQGTIILAERGMTAEAQTLIRCGLETLFYLSATANDASFADALVLADTAHKTKAARRLMELPEELQGLSLQQMENLKKFMQAREDEGNFGKTIRMEDAANKGGLSGIYDTLYRHLCHKASHPSLGALERYLQLDKSGNIVGFLWGPDTQDVPETLNAACPALLGGAKLIALMFSQSDYTQRVNVCWQLYSELIEPLMQAS